MMAEYNAVNEEMGEIQQENDPLAKNLRKNKWADSDR